MGQEIKVSVVVPVYNAQAFLEQCLDSILGQTLEEIEIICVDDGSADESGDILEEISEKGFQGGSLSSEKPIRGEWPEIWGCGTQRANM